MTTQSRPPGPAWRSFIGCALVASACVGLAPASLSQTTGWQSGIHLTGSQNCPPFVFVSQEFSDEPNNWNGFGLDAFDDVGVTALGAPNRKLMFMSQGRSQPELLFPRPSHLAAPLNLPGPLDHGSVHEPSIYHDIENNRYWCIFSYAWDLDDRALDRPCEIYAMDLTTAVANGTSFNPDAAEVVQLTHSATTLDDVVARSFNPDLTPQHGGSGINWEQTIHRHPQINAGACVVDEEHGPVLYFASNERRTDGLGMMAGDLKFQATAPGVQLLNYREIQQFGTTSMISFFETPGGAGGSYRSSTESTGQWSMFEFLSDEAFWKTMSGYFLQHNIADHNGTTVAFDSGLNDSVLAISRYYINNNQSFGTVILLPYDEVGLNYDSGTDAPLSVAQRGALPGPAPADKLNLFPALGMEDDLPSPVGKFATPAAGRVSADLASASLYLAYSDKHSKGNNETDYHSKLVYVKGLATQISPVSSSSYLNVPGTTMDRVQLVLSHATSHAFSMKPILMHAERFGRDHRDVKPLIGPSTPAAAGDALAGLPVAQVMAGPIYNTDILSYGTRKLAGSSTTDKYDPTTVYRNGQGDDRLGMRVSCLTKLLDHQDLEDEVWGVRVFVTDAKSREFLQGPDPRDHETVTQEGSRWGYMHHNGDPSSTQPLFGKPIHHERYRLLSDIKASDSEAGVGQDGLVNFLVPANVPLKFNLLHNDGTVLAAHRNHHSFAPGQLERSCAGCHDHTSASPGPPVYASGAAFDTLTQTGHYAWDGAGTPTYTVTNEPTKTVPEFKADIWPLITQHCASCHDSTLDATNDLKSGVAKFDISMPRPALWSQEAAVWSFLHNERYINRRDGSVRSPFAWHFTGLADDAEVRLDGETNARYRSYTPNDPSHYWITTDFPSGVAGEPHPGIADRSAAYKVLEWIDSGAVMDHAPTVIGSLQGSPVNDPRQGAKGDGYQIALTAKLNAYASLSLQIGFWDVDANVDEVRVIVDTSEVKYASLATLGNHSFSHDLALNAAQLRRNLGVEDTIEIVARDTEQNRVVFRKSLNQLLSESETHRGKISMSVDREVITPGAGQGQGSVTFSVDAPASFAGNFAVLAMGGALYPPDHSLAFNGANVWTLPVPDIWRIIGLNLGFVGPLNGSGDLDFTWTVPVGTAPGDAYVAALIPLADGTIGKSNLCAIRVE